MFVQRLSLHLVALRFGRVLLLIAVLSALVLTAVAPAGIARAAATGGWTTVAGLAGARQEAAMVTLANGRALIAGGRGTAGALSLAEIYDPATNTWTPTGALNAPRASHTLTLLQSGKVLAVGGTGSPAAVEIYNPATGLWAAAAPLTYGRHGHTATLLSNGRVLVAGGRASNTIAAAELYNPVTNSWSAAGNLGTPRFDHAGLLLPNGKVMVAGGNSLPGILSSTEIYDPITNNWSAAAALASARTQLSLNPVNAEILALGGANNGVVSTAERYSLVTGTWRTVAAPRQARRLHSAITLSSEALLLTGGYGASGEVVGTTEIYDATADSWRLVGGLFTPRLNQAVTRLNGGRVLLAGGRNPEQGTLASVEHYDPNTDVSGHQVTLTTTGPGTISAEPGGGNFPTGTTLTLTAQPQPGTIFTGWTVDGMVINWHTQLTLPIATPHTIVATFVSTPVFGDLPAADPAALAVAQLAARGIIRGYEDGNFGPQDTVLRAQMAALIARSVGWDSEDWANPFTDQGQVDADLWRNVGALAHYQVAKGYGDGSFGPTDPVLKAQVISFITRAMVAKGYWEPYTDDEPTRFPNIPASSGHRQDLLTYLSYVDELPDPVADGANWPAWDQPASRAWFAQALWSALDQQFGYEK